MAHANSFHSTVGPSTPTNNLLVPGFIPVFALPQNPPTQQPQMNSPISFAEPQWPDASTTFDSPPLEFPLRKSASESNVAWTLKQRFKNFSVPKHKPPPARVTYGRNSVGGLDSPVLHKKATKAKKTQRKDGPYGAMSAPVTPLNSRPASPSNFEESAYSTSHAYTTDVLVNAARLATVHNMSRHTAETKFSLLPTVLASPLILLSALASHPSLLSSSSLPSEIAPDDVISRVCPEHDGLLLNAARATAMVQGLSSVPRCAPALPREATFDELSMMYDKDLLVGILKIMHGESAWKALPCRCSQLGPSPFTVSASLLMVGSTIDICASTMLSESKNGVILVPPRSSDSPLLPLSSSSSLSHLLFNPLTIAVKTLQQKRLANKILIVNLHVEHAGALQQMFYKDGSVLLLSVHPYAGHGDTSESGLGEGKGSNVNIAWLPGEGTMSEHEYLAALRSVVTPIAQEYGPDIVLLYTAGFQKHVGNPSVDISPLGYAYLVQTLLQIADGRLVLFAEPSGEKRTADCLEACIMALLGEDLPPLPFGDSKPNPLAVSTIEQVLEHHTSFWSLLRLTADYRHYSYNEFVQADKRSEDDTIMATMALAALSMQRLKVGDADENGDTLSELPHPISRYFTPTS